MNRIIKRIFLLLHLASPVLAQDLTLSSYNSSQPEVTARRSITLTDGFYVPAGSSFHAYISAAPAAKCVPLASVLSQDQNYIVTYTPRQPFSAGTDLSAKSTCEVMQTVQYFDGLGRPLQTVQVKGSPMADKDLVTPNEYDAFGREARKYLPYADASNNGSYKPSALSAQPSYYSVLHSGVAQIASPFAVTGFEPSPLNRVVEQGAPGADWQPGSGHTLRTAYSSNDADGISIGSCRWARQYGVTIDASGQRTLTDQGSYGKNQLYVTETKDENWRESYGRGGTIQEYKDKEGRVVLKRTWDKTGKPLSTYYVYDDLGNLCYVLPPKAQPDAGLPGTDVQSNLCYQYRYDERNRVTGKKVPGKGWEYMVYNKLDQVVASQDEQQRKRNEWLVTKYDGLGRVIMSGLWNNNNTAISPGDLKNAVYGAAQWDEKNTSQSIGYQISTYPQGLTTVLTINYYDNYEIPGLPASYVRDHNNMTQSLLTASRTAVLNRPSDMLWSVNYYDNEGRVIKNISQHYKGGSPAEGNYDETDNVYSFTSELTASTRSHKVAATEQVSIKTEYEYDHMGRKVNTWETIGTGGRTLLAQNAYNEIGQLQEKRLHSADQGVSFLQRAAYQYNERGWLKQINDPGALTTDQAFALALHYNDSGTDDQKQYGGNIARAEWQTRVPAIYQSSIPQEKQSYDYRYDPLNRLEQASYTTPGKVGYFNETLTYDDGGNIQTLSRTGKGVTIDQLSYGYENGGQSNRLSSVSDASGSNEGQLSGVTSYQYDDNGNQTYDNRKGLRIEYNVLNIPQKVTKDGTGETITYLYDAAGRKLRKEATGGNRDYIGGIEYGNDGQIEFIQTEEGRAVKSGGTYSYEYMLRDHLGNTRAVVKQDGSILQIPDYYAFGMEMDHNRIGVSPDNRYKYNGKELQTELGMNEYDYGARFYDPVVGRWNVLDPSAEKYASLSPYNYTINNPIKYVDPDGRDFVLTINRDKSGNITGVTVSATVYITGEGASSERADELNDYAQGFFGKQNKTNVLINITYKYRKSVDKHKLGQGENVLTFHSEAENGQAHRSSVNSSKFGNRHFTGNSGNVYSSGKRSNTVLHETLHTMGLSDRYQDKYDPFTNEWYSEPHKGFQNDVMGSAKGTGFDSNYSEYYLEAARDFSEKYNKDRIPLRRMVDMRGNLLLSPYEDNGYHLDTPNEK